MKHWHKLHKLLKPTCCSLCWRQYFLRTTCPFWHTYRTGCWLH